MSELKGACIFGQSGGPTSVINASAYGVIAHGSEKSEYHPRAGCRARHQGRFERPAVRHGPGGLPPSWSC